MRLTAGRGAERGTTSQRWEVGTGEGLEEPPDAASGSPSEPSAPEPERPDGMGAGLDRRLEEAIRSVTDLRGPGGEVAATAALPRGVSRELAALRTRLRDALKGLDTVMFRAATGIARSGVEMKSLVRNMGETHEATMDLLESTRQVQVGAEQVASSAANATTLATETEQVTAEGRSLAGDAVGSIDVLKERMQLMAARLRDLVQQVSRITELSGVIGGMARQTNMLALNAAIEAARAGDAGKGFAVVAAEVRRLAEDTGAHTQDIGSAVEAVTAQLGPTQELIEESLSLVEEGSGKVTAAGSALERIDRFAHETARHMEEIAAAVEEQTAASRTVFDGLEQVAGRVESVRRQTDRVSSETFHLSAVTEDAYRYLAPFRTDTIFHTALELGHDLERRSRALFEDLVDRGVLALQDVLDFEYEEIRGGAIGRLARHFDVSRVPLRGFDPPKYATAYDAVVEDGLQDIYDDIMAREERLTFALILDLNAYVPAHNAVFCRDWTGDPVADNAGNRVKRIYSDNEVLLRGSRMGLGAVAARLPPVASRPQFVAAGCDLREHAGSGADFLVQTYARDTGEVTSALSLPFWVKGHRYGSVFLGWMDDRG